YRWSVVSGSLPSGITLQSTNGSVESWYDQGNNYYAGNLPGQAVLAGTPTATGTYTATLQALDYLGVIVTREFSLTVDYDFNIQNPTLPYGRKGVAYSTQLTAAGGPAPYTWSIIEGVLPEGITLDSATGVLSGTTTTMGNYVITVQVTGTDPQLTVVAQKEYSLLIRDVWDALTGGNHNGADWTVNNNDIIGGYHSNVNDFTVPTGTTVSLAAYDGTSGGIFTINCVNANICGTIDGTGKGYRGGEGPGTTASSGGGGTGGSHATSGGRGDQGPDPLPSYDDPYYPNEMGSGGSNSASGAIGGAGGGIVNIYARKTITLDGVVNNGAGGTTPGCNNDGSGGGAGGSTNLAAQLIQGEGYLIANGGPGGSADPDYGLPGGGGGTGYNVIYYTWSTFPPDHSITNPGPSGGGTAQPGGDPVPPPDGVSPVTAENPKKLETTQDTPIAIDPMYLSTGEFYQEVTDLTIPGRGFPFKFTRKHRAQSWHDGPLGYGWDFNYNNRLEKVKNDIKYYDGLGRIDTYTWDGAKFIPPNGFYTELGYDAINNCYVITETNGTIFTFDNNQVITSCYVISSMKDRNGNEMTFGYGDNPNVSGVQNVLLAITDTLGRAINFTWNADNQIDYFEDWTNRRINFSYDERGDLVSVTYPATTEYPNGNTTAYTYSSGQVDWRLNHNMLTVTDPKGQTYLVNVYDNKDRVITQTYGSGVFVNEYIDAAGTSPAKVKVTDRENNLTEYWLTPQGNVSKEIKYTRGIRPGDPASFTTEYAHITSTERSKTIFPKGNSIEYVYDINNPITRAHGNILRIIQRDTNNNEISVTYTYESRFNQIKTVTDALGRTTTLYFDYEEATMGDINGDGIVNQESGNLVKIVYPTVTLGLSAGQTVEAKFRYNDYGQLIRYVDPEGNIDFYEYYTSGPMKGYLYRITRDEGSESIANIYEYDAVGNVTGIYDGKGNKTTFVINPVNQIMETITRSPFNYRVKMRYDENTKLVKTEIENKDKDGNLDGNMPWITSDYTYNLLDKLTSRTEQISGTESITATYGYDKNGNMNLLTQPLGNKIKRIYDERNQLFETIRGYDTVDWTSTKLYYDINGNLSKMIDGRGKETVYLVDGFDRFYGYVDAEGNRIEYTLDDVGKATRVIRKDSSGVILSETKYLYDELNRRYETQEWLNTASAWVITQFEFDKNSCITRIVNDSSHETKMSYDGLGRITRAEDHLGNKVDYTYDSNSNVTIITETEKEISGSSLTFVTVNSYDNLDRLIESINPITVTRSYRYDSRGNCTDTIDGEGNTVANVYDGLGRLNKIVRDIRAGGTGAGAIIDTITTEYRFDKNSRLYNLVDDKGNITGYLYDDLNRQKEEILADGSRRRFFYDGADNVRQIIDPNGSIIDQTFDNINRLTRRDITRGYGVLGVTYETFGYDGLSRMTSATNDYSTDSMNYDTLSRMTGETQKIGSQSVKTVASGYDNVGNRTQLTYPSGKIVNIVSDELNRISQIKDSSANIIAQYTYAGPYRVTQRDYLNGTKLAVTYDANRRITGLEHSISGTAIAGFAYAYDKENNKLFEKRIHDSNKGDAFVYDSIYRLTGVKYGVPNLNAATDYADYTDYEKKEEFDLDGIGNRTQVRTQNAELITQDYSVNNLNQYTQISGTGLAYDLNGNLKDDGTNLYYFDYLNRLAEVKRKSDNVSIVVFAYDALGRRIQKFNNLQAATLNYYSDRGIVIEERDGNDALIATYVNGNGILTMEKNSQTYYSHANTMGSVYAVTDNSGDVVERYKYAGYGKPTILAPDGVTERQASAIGNTRLFMGKEYDLEIEKYCYGARCYNPTLGRFLQVVESTEELPDTNPEYGENNPENNTETSGNIPEDSRIKPYNPRKRDTIKVKPSFIDQHNPDGSVIRIFNIGTADEFTITLKGPTTYPVVVHSESPGAQVYVSLKEQGGGIAIDISDNGNVSLIPIGILEGMPLEEFVRGIQRAVIGAPPEIRRQVFDALLGYLESLPSGTKTVSNLPPKIYPKEPSPTSEGQSGTEKECPKSEDEKHE
ncbi:MAG TPA: DUF6531 domain-containing protein, partial [Planctomycetota bacterium]|nr:DUF6531 domain-containing protein [Planctomycetota bacterium]